MGADLLATAPPPSGVAPPGASGVEGTVSSYFRAFAPGTEWGELVRWPPDVFALANLVLDHTEGYRFVVAPPPGRRWPPLPDWTEQVRTAAHGWRGSGGAGGELPRLVPPVLEHRPPGRRRSRVVAHWNSRADGLHEIELAPGAAAVLLSTSVEGTTLWTADGRCHADVPRLRLSGVRQLRA